MAEQIIKTEYSDVMQKSYIDYAMSVICQRALPDIRDGLKPVQRRVLYAMDQLGLNYDKPHRKSARIVGDTMGKFHPHGDSSIYDSLVVLSQDFKKGMALVDGHGNFGSIEGDGAAAMRYTEAKLKKFTQEVYLADLDKDVVDFVPNFDETEKEPEVLPVRIPNVLVNGSEGIAVGMTTSIPTHNLSEVIDAEIAYMDNNNITNKELMEYVKGPDFPSGATILGRRGIEDAPVGHVHEGGRGRPRGALRRYGIRELRELHRHDVPRGQPALQRPDLCRLRGLLADGHRRGKGLRHRACRELPPPLFCRQRHRLLAPLAHLALHLAQGLHLHPARRQPMREAPLLLEHPRDVPRQRHLARRQLDLHRLGTAARHQPGHREDAGPAEMQLRMARQNRQDCRHLSACHLGLDLLPHADLGRRMQRGRKDL